MAPTPANMYADVLRHDLCAFIHRSFLELNAQTNRSCLTGISKCWRQSWRKSDEVAASASS